LTPLGPADILAAETGSVAHEEGALMWIFKNLAWLVIMIAVVGFAILNVGGRVSEIRLPGVTYADLPLTVVLFAAFVFGMFLAFIMTMFHSLKERAVTGRLTRENRSLKQELQALRNLPLEDLNVGERRSGGA
jgi:uncharacterized integral membrane protein